QAVRNGQRQERHHQNSSQDNPPPRAVWLRARESSSELNHHSCLLNPEFERYAVMLNLVAENFSINSGLQQIAHSPPRLLFAALRPTKDKPLGPLLSLV